MPVRDSALSLSLIAGSAAAPNRTGGSDRGGHRHPDRRSGVADLPEGAADALPARGRRGLSAADGRYLSSCVLQCLITMSYHCRCAT